MKRPRIKRNRLKNGSVISSADFPIGAFLKDCPLPPELKHLEPTIRGPVGKSLLTALMTCRDEGFSYAQLEDVARQVVEFYSHEYHRCTTCYNWTNDFEAGAAVVDGSKFRMVVICQQCGRRVLDGRITPAMDRNMAEHILGGAL